KRSDLLLALGEAVWPAGETERVIAHVAPDAFALAEKQSDQSRAFRACRLALDCLQAQGASSLILRPEGLRWAELAHKYATLTAQNACMQTWHSQTPGQGHLTPVDGEKPAHCSRRGWRSLDNSTMPRPCSGQRSACC